MFARTLARQLRQPIRKASAGMCSIRTSISRVLARIVIRFVDESCRVESALENECILSVTIFL